MNKRDNEIQMDQVSAIPILKASKARHCRYSLIIFLYRRYIVDCRVQQIHAKYIVSNVVHVFIRAQKAAAEVVDAMHRRNTIALDASQYILEAHQLPRDSCERYWQGFTECSRQIRMSA